MKTQRKPSRDLERQKVDMDLWTSYCDPEQNHWLKLGGGKGVQRRPQVATAFL